MNKSKWLTYENGVLILLGFTFGLVFFERNAIGALTIFIQPDLGLNNTQVGMLTSGLALAWAIAAFFVSAWSDKIGVRKPFILITILVFSACSALSGLATTFLFLLLARVVMGIAEGPFLPICLAVMNVESSPNRRGLNAGILQNVFASIMGVSLAPIILIWLANLFDWRVAFYLSAIPGLICALLVWLYLKEPERDRQAVASTANRSIFKNAAIMLRERNILLCCLISIFMVAFFLIGFAFLPLVLANLRGIAPINIGSVMLPMGVSTMLCGFLVPGLSDKIGRKPIMIAFTFVGIVMPLTALYFNGPLPIMGFLFFIGWSVTGCFPLFMGVIPGETASRALAATSMGLVVSIGELVGGAGGPVLSGWIADQTSLAAPMVVMGVCSVCAGILSLFLTETAPNKVARPMVVPPAA